jgi:formate dehydrogenase subunit gamma
MSIIEARPHSNGHVRTAGADIPRYNMFERVMHWWVAITFIALLLSGLALAYPRMAWLSGLFGGGQTMRAAHPWIGVAFSVGVAAMLVKWFNGMRMDATDKVWAKRMKQYAKSGHTGLDIGRWNAGQKGYFWLSLIFGAVLLITGLPLWFPSIAGNGIRQISRLVHHVAYLIMLAGFIVHVLLSAFLFAGTMQAMTSGKVTRAWAAWHHPRWYREQVEESETVSHR